MTRSEATEQELPEGPIDETGKFGFPLLRWVLLLGVILAVNLVIARVLTAYIDPLTAKGTMQLGLTVLLLLLLYTVLLAIPFVPGVEIGLSLLIVHGSEAAPFVYFATLVGLSASYFFGVAFSANLPCLFLKTLGFHRACAFIDRMKELSREGRLKIMEDTLPGWAGRLVLKKRYLVLALLLNLPGNSLIGGGGGIAMVSGLSRLFSPLGMLVTLALATAPVPALVFFFGSDLIR